MTTEQVIRNAGIINQIIWLNLFKNLEYCDKEKCELEIEKLKGQIK